MSEKKNEKILVTDFVKKYNEYNSDTSKESLLKKYIKRTYCPILEKRELLDFMLNKSIVEDEIKHIDMFINRINFFAAIIGLYTNITAEKDENGNPKSCAMYDLLVENGIMDRILLIIGEREISELTSINGVLLDTWHEQHSSTEACLKRLVETASHKLGVVAGAGMDKLADVIGDEEKMKKVMPMVENMIKRIK